ncbi:hypothetical protein RYX36_021810 [Vicia faba]
MGSLGQPTSDEELNNMIREVDGDGDGCISLLEFIELNMKEKNLNKSVQPKPIVILNGITLNLTVRAYTRASGRGTGRSIQEIRRQWRREDLDLRAGIHNGKLRAAGKR